MKLMKNVTKLIIALYIFNSATLIAQNTYGPVPTKTQLAWHDKEFYLFIHFGPNTFTDLEWGHGSEDPNIFNPTALDCNQWARIAKAAGAKGIILTAKHHDGFSLWPSKYSKHTVRESKWLNGKGDVVKMLSEACKKAGIEMGVYISPWDRNHPDYGTPKYNEVYIQTMKELLTGYGKFFELWWDGANGEGPNGKRQVYDFKRFQDSALAYQPHLMIFSDIGPHIRWIGNEQGIINETNWNLLDTAGFERGAGGPPTDSLNRGNYNGKAWIPGEADVSIRKGWFYHAEEDKTVKSGMQLFDLYLKNVGRGGNFLLNVPPNRQGLFSPADSTALMDFKKIRDAAFKTNLFKNSRILRTNNSVEIHLKEAVEINAIQLMEAISMGQRIVKFEISGGNDLEKFETFAKGTTVGHKRIITFPTQKLKYFRIKITESKATPIISEVSGYLFAN